MSSVYVRTQVIAFLEANSNETVVDLTSVFGAIHETTADAGVQPDAPWLGLEFIGGEELPVALAATNDQGKYREFGAIVLHVVDIARLGGGNALLTRGETLQNLFRGRRINSILVTEMTGLNTGPGATLEFEGGYMSGSFQISYQRDNDL